MPAPIYSTVTVESVEYTQDNTFLGQADVLGSLPPSAVRESSDSVFAVGIHAVDPAIGSGDATNLDSLIGLRILEPGTYADVEVPIFPAVSYPELTDIRSGQTFPPNPNGETEVRAAIWETLNPQGLDESEFPDNADDVPNDLRDLIEPFAVSAPATISELDQNPALGPTDASQPTALAMEVDNNLSESIEELEVSEESGPTLAALTGGTLPLAPGAEDVRFDDLAVVDAGTRVIVTAFGGEGTELGTWDGPVDDGGRINPFFGGV